MIRGVLTLSQLRGMPADEVAALWTVRLAEEPLPHETDLFEEWLELAPANRAAWDRAQNGWNLFESADGDELLDAMRLHARAAGPMVPMAQWRRFGAAAALLLVVATGTLVAERAGMFGDDTTGSTPSVEVASLQYANGRDLPKSVTLPDGSRMTLDAQSRVTGQFGNGLRNLKVVEGRAFFAVRHDAAGSFVVLARTIEVTAIGTRFDVSVGAHNVKVHLVEGRLSVKSQLPPAKPVLMSAGQQLTVSDGGTPRLERSSDDSLGWQQGYARFDDETLAEAADLFNRYPGDRLVVHDRIAGFRISGSFKVGDPERFGHSLQEIYPVRVIRRSPDEVEIVPAT